MAVKREIVQHKHSGERYILEAADTPNNTVVYRAAGPLHHSEHPNDAEMEAWLDNQGAETYDDGDWLASQDYQAE